MIGYPEPVNERCPVCGNWRVIATKECYTCNPPPRTVNVNVPVVDLKILLVAAACDLTTIPYKDFLAAWERTCKLLEGVE